MGKVVALVLLVLISPVVIAIMITVMPVAIIAVVVAIVAAVFLGLARRQIAVTPARLLAVMLAVIVVAVVIAVPITVVIFVFVLIPVFVAIPVMVAVVVVMGEVITIIAIVVVVVLVAVVFRPGSCRQQGTAQTCHDERFQQSLKHTSSLVEMRLEAAGDSNSLKQLYRGMLPAGNPAWCYDFGNQGRPDIHKDMQKTA